MYLEDTIAAISTPAGEGGIGVVRISGPDSLSILRQIFRRKQDGGFNSHRFYYGEVVSPQTGIAVDEALAVYMRAPKSFTREDVVEIQCHSGTVIVQQVLTLVLSCGARLAQPGEFTRRAFLNGRIDLVQAEAVIDMIRAKTDVAATVARQQSGGALSESMFAIRDQLRQALALVEAYIDFPDEDMGTADSERLGCLINSARSLVGQLVASFEEGRVLREGVSVLISGKPNVGKSSLLNALLKEKRAIVTSVPGTTRDLIEEVVNINGLPVKLLDTAGIRVSDDPVEQEGISRALERVDSADLILFVLDASAPFGPDDQFVADSISHAKLLVVLNKSDLPREIFLPPALSGLPHVAVSTRTSANLDALKTAIAEMFLHGRAADNRDILLLSRARHRDALLRVHEILDACLRQNLASASDDLLAIDLREALEILGQVTGETTPDDILDIIFSQFCIGK